MCWEQGEPWGWAGSVWGPRGRVGVPSFPARVHLKSSWHRRLLVFEWSGGSPWALPELLGL